MSIAVPSSYGYVLAAATASTFLGFYHTVLTGNGRKEAKVPYPNAYASPEAAAKDPLAMRFNCAQRAQANYTENHTSFVVMLLIAGLTAPIASACMGAGWVVSRFLYAYGYASNGPKGRYLGFTHYIFGFGLMGLATYSCYNLISSS